MTVGGERGGVDDEAEVVAIGHRISCLAPTLKSMHRIDVPARLLDYNARMVRSIAIAGLCIVSLLPAWCLAQTPPCGTGGIPLAPTGSADPFLSISPSSPIAGLPVTFAAGLTNFTSHSVSVSGVYPYIDVTVRASYLGFATPPGLQCVTGTFGPSIEAPYIVRFYLQHADVPGSLPILVATGALTTVTPGIGVGVSSTGSTVLTYATALRPTCYDDAGLTTISKGPGQVSLVSEFRGQGCFPTPPPALPPRAMADVGYLTAGTYLVTWTIAYPAGTVGPAIPPVTTSLVITADQVPAVVPMLGPVALFLMAAACGGIGLVRLRRRR